MEKPAQFCVETNSVRLNVVAAAMIAAACSVEIASAQTELEDVRIAISGTTFIDASYYPLLLPTALGYWAEEGYRAEVFPIAGSGEAAQQLAANNIDFAQMGGAGVIQANALHSLPIRSLVTNFSLGWGVAVEKGGPISEPADLKGKNVGIVNLSSTGVSIVKAYAQNHGMDPGRDVTLIATGVGAQALLALQNDQVQALMYWSSALAGFQSMDPNLKVWKDPLWAQMPDYSFVTSQRMIDKSPKMVEGISRGVAKAMAFAAANPDCARQVLWKAYPDMKPTNVDEKVAIANDLAKISILLEDQANASKLNPEGQIAGVNVDAIGRYQDFLFASGVLAAKADPANFVISEGANFWSRVNNFARSAIEESARACDF